MKKTLVALCAVMLVSGFTFAEETTTATQAAKAGYARPSISPEERAAMFKAAYEYAGISAENIKKLEDLESKRQEARGDKSKMDEIRKERMSLVTRDQQASVTQYFREHGPWAKRPKADSEEKKSE